MRISSLLGGPLIVMIMVFGFNWCDDEHLALKKKSYKGKEIKIAGFYYGKAVKDYSGAEFHNLICLYDNGTLLLAGSTKKAEMESYMLKIRDLDLLKETKAAWGLFEVKNDSIKLAYWEAEPCGYPAILQLGTILNDSTFVLSAQQIKRKGRVETQLNIGEEYHFRPFNSIPAKENNFLDDY